MTKQYRKFISSGTDYLCRYSDKLRAGRPAFDSWHEQKIFLYFTAIRLALGPTQPPAHWILGALSRGVKWPGCETDHSPPSTAEVENDGAILPLPHTSSWRGA
jgi:hypothetical protein